MYSDSAIELLLPELEAGLFDEHWRIRYSSVQLLGDLLFRISGVTGKQTTMGDEDDNFGTAHSAQVKVCYPYILSGVTVYASVGKAYLTIP